MTAECGPTQTPADIDIDALREKYRVERLDTQGLPDRESDLLESDEPERCELPHSAGAARRSACCASAWYVDGDQKRAGEADGDRYRSVKLRYGK